MKTYGGIMKSFIDKTHDALRSIMESEVNEIHGQPAANWQATKDVAEKIKADMGIAAVPMFSKGKNAFLQLPAQKFTPEIMSKLIAYQPKEIFARNDSLFLVF
jgi:hypothetical protein